MAGYSETPLRKKLGIKEDHKVLFVDAPSGFDIELGELPPRTFVVAPQTRGPIDVILFFVKTEKDLKARFMRLAAKLATAGGFWVAWPKKSSGVVTNLTFDVVQRVGLDAGLVDNKICAVDEIWSGLRFVIRVKDRTG